MEKKKFLEIGKIVAVQGLKGEVRVDAWCDSPDFFCEFDKLYFNNGNEEVFIEHSRPHKNVVVAKIKGIDTVEDAEKLRNKILYMDRDDVFLPKGSYFVQDLIGLTVVDNDTGEIYGTLSNVSSTGANDVYTIKKDDKEYLIPAIPDVVIKTDLENEKMYIHKLDGLFE